MKEGYKNSEVGLIPDDWEIVPLGELGNTFNGLVGKTKNDFGQGKPYITYMNIYSNPKLKNDFVDFVEIGEAESQNSVQYGDIFFTTSSETADEVGLSSVLLDNIEECYLNSFCFGFRMNNFESLSPRYAVYLLRGERTRKTISVLAQGSTRYNLSKITLLKKLNLPLPPLPEQEKIAAILRAVDEKIDLIDQQLAETQALKRGMMQRLLTQGIGHTQFKDSPLGKIPESWEVVRLGEISEISSGATPNREKPEYWNGDIPWITTSLIKNNEIRNSEEFITQLALENSSTKLFPKETILMAMYGQGVTRGKVAILKIEATTNQACCAIITKSKIFNLFLYYQLQFRYNELRNLSNAGGQENLSGKIIKSIQIILPSIQEQKRFSAILREIDKKIQTQTEKKTAYQTLKTGLMQQLLTGKTRVKLEQTA